MLAKPPAQDLAQFAVLEKCTCVPARVRAHRDTCADRLGCSGWSRGQSGRSNLLLPSEVSDSSCRGHSHPGEVQLGSQHPATRLDPHGPTGSLAPQAGCHMSAVAWKGGLVWAGDGLPNPLRAHAAIRFITFFFFLEGQLQPGRWLR